MNLSSFTFPTSADTSMPSLNMETSFFSHVSIIKSQLNRVLILLIRDCPNDVNEAVSSLIFASARCGDLPELPVIRKLFGERYGQRFAVVALELLPGNLVNRQVVN